MTPDDLVRLRHPAERWRPDMRCADCWGSPSCPQLHDALWLMVWELRPPKAPRRCNCWDWDQQGSHSAKGPRVSVGPETHWRTCDVARAPRRRELLCLECAEVRLDRQLTLLDLKPCLGNYHTFAEVHRLAGRVANELRRYVPRELWSKLPAPEHLADDLCGLPRRRTFDQFLADSSVGQGLARVRAGHLALELRQYEQCPRGADRSGRHLWNKIPDEISPEWSQLKDLGFVEHCACGAAR